MDVREFKGMILIDIREYYETADGEMRPGKKGIALNPEQWEVWTMIKPLADWKEGQKKKKSRNLNKLD